ncbi:MAG: Spx/MgsR family RNA polymerase-binding regulatory protein [Bacteroidota bacterium]
MIIYGIKNCDTMKKAFTWLNDKGITYDFFDYKKQQITKADFDTWLKAYPIETIVNTKGTTYKNLSDADKSKALNPATAFDIISQNQSIIKRPVINNHNQITVGFDNSKWEQLFR